MATSRSRKTPAKKAKAGHGKGTAKAGGKKKATPAKSSTQSRAKDAGPEDRKLSPLDRVKRARRIAAKRAKRPRAQAWTTIAKDEGLSERQVRRIYDDYLTWEARRGNPDRLIQETLDTIEAAMEELDDVIVKAAADGNHNARVGAVRLLLESVAGRWDVMRAAGLIPASMARWRDSQDARAIFEAMARVLKRHNIGDEVLDELMKEMQEGQDDGRGLPAGDVFEGSVA